MSPEQQIEALIMDINAGNLNNKRMVMQLSVVLEQLVRMHKEEQELRLKMINIRRIIDE
jgi:hypothetical protein